MEVGKAWEEGKFSCTVAQCNGEYRKMVIISKLLLNNNFVFSVVCLGLGLTLKLSGCLDNRPGNLWRMSLMKMSIVFLQFSEGIHL